MKRLWMFCMVALTAQCISTHAQVTPEQIAEAARNPAAIVAVMKAAPSSEERVQALNQTIAAIAASELSDAAKTRHIARLISEAVVALDADSSAVIGPVAAANPQWLPVITSAAVYSSGHMSPAMLDSILASAGTTETAREQIRQASRNPVGVLGAPTVSRLPIIPMAVVMTPVFPLEMPREGHARDITELPGPPRPPAPKYRGQ